MALTREQINREMEEYSRIRGEMHDKIGKGVVSACDDIYRRIICSSHAGYANFYAGNSRSCSCIHRRSPHESGVNLGKC